MVRPKVRGCEGATVQHDCVVVDVKVNPHLTFNGNCEAAFTFYARCLGGQLGTIFRYAGSPLATQVPADWQDKVMAA